MNDKPNGAILKNIKLQYSGEELELQLLAWNLHPTLKSDCFVKSMEKAALRSRYVKELKAQKVVAFDNGTPNHFIVKIEK